MPTQAARIRVENRTDRPRVVWVEPWGEDYTLRPGETLEVVARGDGEPPWFHLVEWPDGTQVYLEAAGGDYEVTQGGHRLECGHNRQVAVEAGLKL